MMQTLFMLNHGSPKAIMKISRKKIKYGLNIKTGVFQRHGLNKLKHHAAVCTAYLSEGESW